MDFDLALKIHFDELNPREKEVAKTLYNSHENLADLGIVNLAKKTLTSKSAILRLSKKLGFSGFIEMKQSLANKYVVEDKKSGVHSIRSWHQDVHTLLDYLESVDFEPILEGLNSAERIFIYPTGSTQQHYASVFYQYILLKGHNVFLLMGQSSLDNALSLMTKNDLFLVVDYKGNTEHDKEALKLITLKEVPILSITEFGHNFMSDHANYSLFYDAPRINEYDVSLLQLGMLLDYLIVLINNVK